MDGRFSFPLDALQFFRTAGRGPWNRVGERPWNEWHRQPNPRITTLHPVFQMRPLLTPAEFSGTKWMSTKLKLGITPDYFNLINPADEFCPCDPIMGLAHQRARDCRQGIGSRVFDIDSAVAPVRSKPSEGVVSPELV